ncbi:HAD hydrolase-like protein [Secundilactobacillus sp. HBUAS58055]|nr:HAD hydrolase-like protein [Secundilactobacillus angelensis]MCH5461843.1 HAD hydrolase-like protein [Secundilactobacillus angelensis]
MNNQVFFDFDGTIANSERGIIHAVKSMVDELNLPHLSDVQYRLFIGPTITDSLKKFFPSLTEKQVSTAVKAYKKNYESSGLFDLEIYPGIEDALTTMRAAGYQLNIASAKPESVLRKIIDEFQLNHYFDGIYGASEGKIKRIKKTDILAYAIETSHAQRDQSVMVGDRYTDMKGGNDNHVKTLGVTYGFGDAAELRASNASALVSTPEELPAEVAKLLGERR